uniref:Xaa-Pro dipeptidase n=1 Tax=Tetraselmis sp. GSL018 TaxID=582737 RepID=A0A061RJ50_9CHLO
MPRLPPEHAVWMGPIDSPDQVQTKYGVDEVHYVDEMITVLATAKPPVLHLLSGTNSDSSLRIEPPTFDGMDKFVVETETLHRVLTECRVRKTPLEIEVMRYANRIASEAHIKAMRECRPGMMEYQLESAFLSHCYSAGGCRHAPYTPICASGPNGAVLHYGHAAAPNNRQLQDGDMMLCDMGCEYHGYDSDITVSFPVSGKFTEDQSAVYRAVLDASRAVIASIRPGVKWPDMHGLALRKILEGLKRGGFVQGDVDAMMEKDLGALFMPHGLGHLIGLDTHDVGGYGPGLPERIDRPSYRALRMARELEEGMVVTVEPGCYFNSFLLLPALEDEDLKGFLVKDRIASRLGSGGVRIEDDVVVTADGCENLTDVPREPEDVEAVMAGACWPLKQQKLSK